MPAYIVFSDVALRQMARYYPASDGEFARISGVGEKKLREFGEVFLGEIAAHLQTNPRQIFADDSFTATPGIGDGEINTVKTPGSITVGSNEGWFHVRSTKRFKCFVGRADRSAAWRKNSTIRLD